MCKYNAKRRIPKQLTMHVGEVSRNKSISTILECDSLFEDRPEYVPRCIRRLPQPEVLVKLKHTDQHKANIRERMQQGEPASSSNAARLNALCVVDEPRYVGSEYSSYYYSSDYAFTHTARRSAVKRRHLSFHSYGLNPSDLYDGTSSPHRVVQSPSKVSQVKRSALVRTRLALLM